ncbi:MAG: L,D-transpeptidase family protein [Planctomycetaceae bacterium]|nr:L,D-transpeptidase family protein [Planctomycetaceae bacterium]
MTPLAKQIAIVVGSVVVLIALIVGWNKFRSDSPAAADPATAAVPAAAAAAEGASAPTGAAGGSTDAAERAPAPTPTPESAGNATNAMAQFDEGIKLMEAGKFFPARVALSSAVFSGALPADKADHARKMLTSMAERTLFAPGFFDDDPYVARYEVKNGDVLQRIERNLKLHVPTELLLKINNLSSDKLIRAGQSIKVIKGPFHAVISLSGYTMDLYLKRDNLPYIYIRRFTVGTGKEGATPFGAYHVALGGKKIKPVWNPPPSSGRTGSIRYGEPNYAFGPKGLWIALEGTDPVTKTMSGYGIHSTNDPASIGKSQSLGCIRMADADIDYVFLTLYEHWSSVLIKK